MSTVEQPVDSARPDSLSPRSDFPVHLQAFEGPLDLLLFLIRRNEVDIYNIPVEEVTSQYLDAIRDLRGLSLEQAGEFFVMASTLMYIKSRMLLPPEETVSGDDDEDDEEDVDPRWELVQQLVQYKKFKEAALRLRERIEETQDLLPRIFRSADEERLEAVVLQSVDRIAVWNAFNRVLRRIVEQQRSGAINDELVSTSDRMEAILALVAVQEVFDFEELLAGDAAGSPSYVVSTFLAILELVRLGHIVIEQRDAFGPIHCRAVRTGGLTSDQESGRAATIPL